jgi:MerR family redox-sensitive transcriptional activator SoxR
MVMATLMIGQLAQRAGVAASALRYYERAGLLPPPARSSNRRQYDPNILGRIRIILLARKAGFTVSETRAFLNRFPVGTTPAVRWREMAKKKLAELDELMAQVAQMKAVLNASFNCECRQLEDCERLVAAKNRCRIEPNSKTTGAAKDPLQRLRSKRQWSW